MNASLRRLVIVSSAAVFFGAIFTAMLTYHGGSGFIPDAPRYMFLQDFLSDLGMTHGFNNEVISLVTRVLFGIALFAGVAAALVFFQGLPGKTPLRTVLLGVFVIGICALPFIPSDLYTTAHRVSVVAGFIALTLACLVTLPVLPKGWLVSALRIYTTLACLYILWLFFAPRPEYSQLFLMAHVALQKFVIFSFILLTATSTLIK
jgi:hypothetical protein